VRPVPVVPALLAGVSHGHVRLALLALLAGLSFPPSGTAASLRLLESSPQQFDFVDIARLPPGFGRGEFAFELWIKPDASFPVGPTWRGSKVQLQHWSDADPEPESTPGWWLAGNFLLDGHTRPRGFDGEASREGTFSLQFHGGGRLRWMFADGDLAVPGKVWAVQAWPATSTPSLLDGRWHHVVAQRRWHPAGGAVLELWIDGERVAHREIPDRVDMRRWWDALAHPDDPVELGGWALGAEVMTAWDQVFNQYEDYKGLVDDMRIWSGAMKGEQIVAAARGEPVDEATLLAHFSFDEGRGEFIGDRIDPGYRLRLHRGSRDSWAGEDAPSALAAGPAVKLPPEDRRAIHAAALDYAEGWYSGDPSRMQQSLHPDLAKRRVASDQAGDRRLVHMDRRRLLAGNRPQNAARYANAPRRADVLILDGFGHVATVKLVMDEWVDYMHVVRDEHGEWRVINVLWDVLPDQGVEPPAQIGARGQSDQKSEAP